MADDIVEQVTGAPLEVKGNFFDQYDNDQQAAPAEAKPNSFDQFDNDPDAGEPGLWERARLNSLDSFYRGTLAGSGRLKQLADAANSGPYKDEPGLDPEVQKTQRELHEGFQKAAQEEYQSITTDLARYDTVRPWGTTMEAATALGGQIVGAIPSPESLVGLPAKGATMLGRAVRAGLQQAGINTAVDPLVQATVIGAGAQNEYEWTRTAAAPFVGFIVGGGLHFGGEVISQKVLGKARSEIVADDPSMRGANDPEPPLVREPEPPVTAAVEPLEPLRPGDTSEMAKRQGGGTLPMERARPDQGTPVGQQAATGTAVANVPVNASPQQAVAIRSLQQQSFDFATALGFPLHEGRVANKKALGTFNSQTGVVRVKEVPDFEVVVHEGGHHLELKIGKELTNLTNQFDTELAPLVSNAAAYDPSQHVREGFAEYIRRYVGNPAHAQQVAPAFSIAFRQLMEKKAPEVLTAIDAASVAYRAYLTAPSIDSVGAVRRSVAENPKGWRGVVKKIKDNGFAPTIRKVLQDSYTVVSDDKAPVARAVRDMAAAVKQQKGAPVDLKSADNPEVLLRLFARTEQAAIMDMQDGVRPHKSITPHGPSLAGAIAKAVGQPSVFGRWDPVKTGEFSNYLIARQADNLWRKFERGELQNPPTAFSKGDAAVAMADFERANPTFHEASEMVHGYTRELLAKAYDGGLIDNDLFSRLLKEDFYVPFMRDMRDKPLADGDSAKKGVTDRVADVIKKRTGSARDIMDPIESLMVKTNLINRAVRHNDIIRSFVDLARSAGRAGGRFVEELPAHEAKKYTFDLGQAIERRAKETGADRDDTKLLVASLADLFGEDPMVGSFFKMEPAGKRGEPIVFFKRAGELKAARFMAGEEGHALYETLTALPSGLADIGTQLLSVGSSVLRAGVTTDPSYVVANYIRDQVATGILRPDYIPFYSGTRGIKAELLQEDPAKLYGYAGGVSAGASIAPLQQAAESNIQALAKQGYVMNRLTSLHGLLEMASLTEAGTRNSVFATVFNQKRKQGLSEYESMVEAAYQAQDVLDFSRWGSKTLAIRALTPFVNAWMQGMDKARRTLIEPLYREMVFASDVDARRNAYLSLGKVFGAGGVLGAAWAAIHSSDEIYQDASPELKGTHFLTSIGGKVLVIPKPFELSVGFTAGEFAFQKLMKDDPRAAEQFIKAAHEVMTPPRPFIDNPLIKTSIELGTGKALYPSIFSPRDIVPGQMQRLAPEQQFNERTSALAKQLGKSIGVSPLKVEHAIGGFFGTWGRDIMVMSGGMDERAPARDWEDRAFIRRYIKDPTRTSDVTTKFWDYMGPSTGKFNQAVATYDDLNKRFRDDQAREFLAKLKPAERTFVILRSAADDEGRAAFSADQRRLHPLQRAYDAATLLNGVRRELADDAFKYTETGQNVKLDPVKRRAVMDQVREIAQMEMRNALVITKEPGYENRPMLSTKDSMAVLKALSPEVADEVATRYASSKIFTADAVAATYERMRDGLLRYGSTADLGDLLDEVAVEGYEFGAVTRVKKAPKRRTQIKP
jgi:hypothetical protein